MLTFINLLLLTYGPFYAIYRGTTLHEERAWSSCIVGAAGYFVAQALKMFFFAAFIPSSSTEGFNATQEILKAIVSVVELVGIRYALRHSELNRYSPRMKVVVAGLGWAAAESVAAYFVQFWIGTKEIEFDWSLLELGIISNINIVLHIAFAAAVWLTLRIDSPVTKQAYALQAVYFFVPSVFSFLSAYELLSSVSLLVMRAGVTGLMAVSAAALMRRYLAKRA